MNDFCERNPGLVFPSFTNCAQFYECAHYNDRTGTYLHECAYPLLYDTSSQTCQPFTRVSCGQRPDPQAPCQYTLILLVQVHQNSVIVNSTGPKKKLRYNCNLLYKRRDMLTCYWQGFKIGRKFVISVFAIQ